jgi:hypothetical protein
LFSSSTGRREEDENNKLKEERGAYFEKITL